jgi:hypothetical protein
MIRRTIRHCKGIAPGLYRWRRGEATHQGATKPNTASCIYRLIMTTVVDRVKTIKEVEARLIDLNEPFLQIPPGLASPYGVFSRLARQPHIAFDAGIQAFIWQSYKSNELPGTLIATASCAEPVACHNFN